MTFGELLKTLREERGVSQARLARHVSLDHSYLSRLESGQRSPSIETIVRIAKALNLSPQEALLLLLAAAGWQDLFGESLPRVERRVSFELAA